METGPIYFKQREHAIRPEDGEEVAVVCYVRDDEDDTYVYVEIDGVRPDFIPKWAEPATFESKFKTRISESEFLEWFHK